MAKIKTVVPVPTAGGCHMYYGSFDNGNWFFTSDSWGFYAYEVTVNPQKYMWDDDFEEIIKPYVYSVIDIGFDDFWNDMMHWLIFNGHPEFKNY